MLQRSEARPCPARDLLEAVEHHALFGQHAKQRASPKLDRSGDARGFCWTDPAA